MHLKSNIAASLLFTALLSGCNTVSEEGLRVAQVALKESPTLRAEAMKDCVADFRNDPLADRIVLANHMKVEVSQMPQVACRRLLNALANGRIKKSDLTSSSANDFKMLRILQGQ